MKLPNIPADLLYATFKNYDSPKDILYYYIRQLVLKSQRTPINVCDEFYLNSQAASLVFGNGNLQDRITLKLNHYGDFFTFEGNGRWRKFKPDIEKLIEHHPQIFGISKPPTLPVKEEILKSLKDEVAAVSTNSQKEYLQLDQVVLIGKVNSLNVYQAEVIIESDDQVIQLPEGINVKYKNKEFKAYVTILEYNPVNNVVTFQTSTQLYSGGYPKLESSTVFLLYHLIERIEKMSFESLYFRGLFELKIKLQKHDIPSNIDYGELYDSQKQALLASLKNSVTFIWGPPGTGKSYTISKLLQNIYLLNEKTLVCSIANVAVDGLTKKLVDRLRENNSNLLQAGRILRIGYINDAELKKINELFPKNPLIDAHRERIQILEERLANTEKTSEKYALLLSELDQAKKALASVMKERIQNASIILCTSSKAIIESAIADNDFDNLVIDEGSMMAAPQLLGLLKNIRKRVIVAGDFRQLGPIALSATQMSDKWLKTSLFDLLGKEDTILNHPCLKMLTSQRRCADPIIQLINKDFYDRRLNTIPSPEHNLFIDLKPNKNKHIGFLDLENDPDNICQYSSSHSRYNLYSQSKVMQIVGSFLENNKLRSVGIITPYRAQANNYKKAISNFNIINHPSFIIKAGTIHSFQGSESDVIIFDMVDSPYSYDGNQMPIGNLFYQKTGERLINVAISRAIGKLIIVGCSTHLLNGPKYAQVSIKVRRIIDNARVYSLTGVKQ